MNKAIKKQKVERFIAMKPEAVLIIRLSLGLSQREFVKLLNGKLSQVTLVKYEKGNANKIQAHIAKNVASIAPKRLKVDAVLRNYKRFSMMHRGYMPRGRARKLQELSLKKTTKMQRKLWGRLGAMKANAKQRPTEQEMQIQNLLEKLKISYTTHELIESSGLKFNIDFVIRKGNRICFLEVSKRKHDISILAQAYGYRSRVLRETYPRAKFVAIFDEIPLGPSEILNKEFDLISDSNSLKVVEEFLLSF